MYKIDKKYLIFKAFSEVEKGKLFWSTDSLSERLSYGWYLTAITYGIDPLNPPKMEKRLTGMRKHPN